MLWKRTLGSRVALIPNLNCGDEGWRTVLRDVRVRRAMSLAINRILQSEGHLNNKAIILWLIQALETTDDVVTADVIRKTLEIVVGYTMDDI